MRILLTGATGFLGSHMAEDLIANNYELILTKREFKFNELSIFLFKRYMGKY